MGDLDAILARLYAVPLGRFVEERKAIARELRAAGERELAAQVDKIARPSVTLWTLHQLARRHGREIQTYHRALDRQRELQLSGDRFDVDALREAREAEKQALASVLDCARELLTDGGHAASRHNLERVSRALRAVALDAERRAALARGLLQEEPSEQGFDAISAQVADPGALPAASPRRAEPAPTERPAEPKPRKRDSAFARSARAHASRAPRAASSDSSEERARRAAALRSQIEAIDAEIAALRRRLDERERELASLRAALAETEAEAGAT